MWSWLTRRITNKILFPVLGIFLLLSGSTLGYIQTRIKQDLLASATQEALTTTQILAVSLYRDFEIDHDAREIQSYILGPSKYRSTLYRISVIDRGLRVVSSTQEDLLFEQVEDAAYVRALENRHTVETDLDAEPPHVRIVHPVSAGPEPENVATGIIEVHTSLAPQLAALARIRANTLVAGLIIVVGISVVVTLISLTITGPLRSLYEGMGRVNEGALDVRVPVVSRDEVGYLTTTFNAMIARLGRLLESSQRFVPQQFLTALGKADIADVMIGDATLRTMTVFFMDIRGFTEMSERMSAEENLRFLNVLLERVLPAIETNGGFVDKYMGDAIMALFPEAPDDAVRAAVALQAAMAAFSDERAGGGQRPVTVGVGINRGELILGTVGSGRRLDTTVIGSIVNVASRLEKLTKDLPAPIILPAEVFAQLQPETIRGIRHVDLGRVEIRGVEEAMALTGVLGAA